MKEAMSEYGYLLSIAIILLSTKVLGLTTQKFKLPQVVGALFAGLVYLLVCIWSKVIALSIFKWIVLVMLVVQVLFTIPVAIKGCKEGDE